MSTHIPQDELDDDVDYPRQDAEARAQQDEDQRLDDPRHGQAQDINRRIE